MSNIFTISDRQTVPRFLDYSTACYLGLSRTVNRFTGKNLEENIKLNNAQIWNNNHTIFNAVDLVSEAILIKEFDSTEATNAAKYLISLEKKVHPIVKELAEHYLSKKSFGNDNGIIDDKDNRAEITSNRKLVNNYVKNPIAWSDLSLCYAKEGNLEKSKRAMEVALGLGKSNRFILRSAARCFVHIKEPDRALKILHQSGLCSLDPWIAAAEVAISDTADLTSKCIGKAKNLVDDENYTNFSRSELRASMGTVELKYGSTRRARKLFRESVIDPTENALAQTHWFAIDLGQNIAEISNLVNLEANVPGSFEAKALRAYNSLEFEDSVKYCKKWGRFQQLSSRPVVFSSNIASCFLDNDLEAIKILEEASSAQIDNFSFHNNYAVSLARCNRVEEAYKQMRKINFENLSEREKSVYKATSGLILFRDRDYENGRVLYQTSIIDFDRLEDKVSAAIAAHYFAIEEMHISNEGAKGRIEEAKKRIEKLNHPVLNALLKKYGEGKAYELH